MGVMKASPAARAPPSPSMGEGYQGLAAQRPSRGWMGVMNPSTADRNQINAHPADVQNYSAAAASSPYWPRRSTVSPLAMAA